MPHPLNSFTCPIFSSRSKIESPPPSGTSSLLPGKGLVPRGRLKRRVWLSRPTVCGFCCYHDLEGCEVSETAALQHSFLKRRAARGLHQPRVRPWEGAGLATALAGGKGTHTGATTGPVRKKASSPCEVTVTAKEEAKKGAASLLLSYLLLYHFRSSFIL